MKYNAPPGSQDPNAPYVNGIPGVQKGSPVPAEAVEYDQREIINVIEAAGLTPTNDELDQLLQAIRLLFPDISAFVPNTRKISTAYPLRIDSGGSADLSTDRTLSIVPPEIKVFTSSGTYTVPMGISRILAILTGGGGGGYNSISGYSEGGGGGAGGTAIIMVNVVPAAELPYVIGGGAPQGGATEGAGGDGGTSTFLGAIANGGKGAKARSQYTGDSGSGSSATGGILNMAGGAGGYGVQIGSGDCQGGQGGSSFWGGGGRGVPFPNDTTISQDDVNARCYGAGGGGKGDSQTSLRGGAGGDGVLGKR